MSVLDGAESASNVCVAVRAMCRWTFLCVLFENVEALDRVALRSAFPTRPHVRDPPQDPDYVRCDSRVFVNGNGKPLPDSVSAVK
ncbi:hypothetical protein MRB53_025906 [Persea americana]|uniref:Uncharacterized protein n=1 Tax=Persea americana TaxID=3435 RepID=A0ACC2LH44_PERAE|nr:hypothetical protein MRB53_025906 [Persea americana]